MPSMTKTSIYNISDEELRAYLKSKKLKPFRMRQIKKWLDSGVSSADEMTNLSRELRADLANDFDFFRAKIVLVKHAGDKSAKYLFRLSDGETVEAVSMMHRYGCSVCVSSQVGCRMGCKFCASGADGLLRNLSPAEMKAQLDLISADSGQKIKRIVVMGMGEPFDNFDNVLEFLKEAHESEQHNISYRRMTVSTCGLVPRMIEFSDKALPVNLAVSLHASNDKCRNLLMPIAHKYKIADIIEAGRYYTNKTGRRISFEYALFKDINDSVKDAEKLAELLKGMLCHVNIIAGNENPCSFLKASSPDRVRAFRDALDRKNIPQTLRRSLGSEILAACGQLRRSKKNEI